MIRPFLNTEIRLHHCLRIMHCTSVHRRSVEARLQLPSHMCTVLLCGLRMSKVVLCQTIMIITEEIYLRTHRQCIPRIRRYIRLCGHLSRRQWRHKAHIIHLRLRRLRYPLQQLHSPNCIHHRYHHNFHLQLSSRRVRGLFSLALVQRRRCHIQFLASLRLLHLRLWPKLCVHLLPCPRLTF